jgi:epoxyqueuosine reductase
MKKSGKSSNLSMNEIWDKVLHQLKAIGCDARVVAAGHVNELREEIETSRSRGRFFEEFYQERLTFFEFHQPGALPNPESIIVIAVPQPQVEVMFIWNGKTRRCVVPPTYSESINGHVQGLMKKVLELKGYHLAPTALPLKLLAVRSGLAAYGKNNISYVHGMGSYHRLMAFYSDLECTSDSWGPSTMMERCVKCSACVKGCPTQAIDHERFLLRAERCLTFHNESLRDFPGWIQSSWHHCIVGCMECQKICPENKRVKQWVEIAGAFSQEETEALMCHTSVNHLPARVKSQLERLGLIEYLDILPRNLNLLMQKEDGPLSSVDPEQTETS